jgi:hypothetical protein
MVKRFECLECGKIVTADVAPECCGQKMEEMLEVCREAPSAEQERPFNSDEPCDDGSSGKRV